MNNEDTIKELNNKIEQLEKVINLLYDYGDCISYEANDYYCGEVCEHHVRDCGCSLCDESCDNFICPIPDEEVKKAFIKHLMEKE